MKFLVINGRRWFDRVNGNTYHNVDVWIDGDHVHESGFTYGYDDCYIQTAHEWLLENKLLPGSRKSPKLKEALWRYCERKKIKLITTVADVGRKKDL